MPTKLFPEDVGILQTFELPVTSNGQVNFPLPTVPTVQSSLRMIVNGVVHDIVQAPAIFVLNTVLNRLEWQDTDHLMNTDDTVVVTYH